jgi:hypothetical protein
MAISTVSSLSKVLSRRRFAAYLGEYSPASSALVGRRGLFRRRYDQPYALYRPFHCGFRFSAKARGPSFESSVRSS